ncbi:ABC transporter permease [Flavobacterium aciduliphilum]|uniref:Lipoprotein-releasing system permease protein n=1 Tax=Flavobacterium aciduliphilum TaxID=1101402 RepID=A0A328YF47_9FLAO|nr:FtsX-like permease family protein [Flavobacterium aciduliphilum]RAR72539.1 lipoprotein-releasing system permease protein [Flavobacterium aciduliphilum]
MNFPLYIAQRYIFSKSKNNAINIITRIASGGIIVGAMALFVVLSVFSGLREFSLSFSNDFDPDLKLFPATGKIISITPKQLRQLEHVDGLASYSKIIEERVLFSFDSKQQVALLKGVDENYGKVNKATTKLFNGQWLKKGTTQCVIGYGISEKLSLGLFDFNNDFDVYVPKPGKGAIENPEDAFNKAYLAPVGIYAISEELDNKYVFTDLGLAQELLELSPQQMSGVEIRLKKNANENQVVAQLNQIFGNQVVVKTRAALNATLYKMLNTENIAVYLIFTLVIIIALFNLIGALIMMILDKKANLKTLYNLGAELKSLRQIFLLQGTLLTVLGGIIGLLLGIIIVLVQQKYKLIMITSSLAYPVVLNFENIVIVFTTLVLLGFLASVIASSRVGKKLLD